MPTATCRTCARIMRQKSDFPRGNFSSEYCSDCVDARGLLKTKEEIRAQMIRNRLTLNGMTEDEAAEQVNNILLSLPGWARRPVVSY